MSRFETIQLTYCLGAQMCLCSLWPHVPQGLWAFELPLFACCLVVCFVSVLLMSRENSRTLVERPDVGGGLGMRQNWGAKEKSNWDISCSSPHFCLSCTYVLISFLFIIGFFCLFVCFLLSPETPFHFTLPKEGDIIPPLTGATPPLIGHLKLEPKRHSTPIGEWLNVMMFKAEFLRYHSIRQWFFYIWGVGPAWWDWFLS